MLPERSLCMPTPLLPQVIRPYDKVSLPAEGTAPDPDRPGDLWLCSQASIKALKLPAVFRLLH